MHTLPARLPVVLLPMVLLAACPFLPHKDIDVTTRDTGGNDEAAWGCVETGRTPVADPTVAADGFAFSAFEAYGPWVGTWAGSFTVKNADGTDGDILSAWMQVQVDGDVQAVTYEAETGSDSGMELGAPESDCAPAYEIPLAVHYWMGMDDITDLETDAQAIMVVSSIEDIGFFVTLDPGTVATERAPTSFDPAEMDETWLSLNAHVDADSWWGDWSWQASRVIDEQTAMGVLEPLGTFDLPMQD